MKSKRKREKENNKDELQGTKVATAKITKTQEETPSTATETTYTKKTDRGQDMAG